MRVHLPPAAQAGAALRRRVPANPRALAKAAEKRFPVRVKIGVPPDGLGTRLDEMQAGFDENSGADDWAMTPVGALGVVNDAVAVYLLDATLAAAFVAPWCTGHKAETAEGVFRVRDDSARRKGIAKGGTRQRH